MMNNYKKTAQTNRTVIVNTTRLVSISKWKSRTRAFPWWWQKTDTAEQSRSSPFIFNFLTQKMRIGIVEVDICQFDLILATTKLFCRKPTSPMWRFIPVDKSYPISTTFPPSWTSMARLARKYHSRFFLTE